MAKMDNAVLKIDTGHYFTAPVGTAAPANLLAPGAEWEEIGHTSLDKILSLKSDGGEATVLGTLQSKTLRTSYSNRTETMSFTLEQFDKDSLKLYFGANMTQVSGDPRFMGVPQSAQPTTKAFLVVFVDGQEVFAFWAPKVEIVRGDDMELSDTESFAGLPLNVTPMTYQSNAFTWAITPLASRPAPTGATAGTPGTVTPTGAYMPYNLAGLSTVTASPTTKWTVGQYIDLQDGTTAYWDGTAWKAGKAV